jgi:hypothetical protein
MVLSPPSTALREAGQKSRVHRQGRGLAVCHAVLGHDIAQILGLVKRYGAGRLVESIVHA